MGQNSVLLEDGAPAMGSRRRSPMKERIVLVRWGTKPRAVSVWEKRLMEPANSPLASAQAFHDA